MDEHARQTFPEGRGHDLAAIVLAEDRPRFVGDAGFARAALTGDARGYDTRSVLVLAVVIALIAAFVGWAMTLSRDEAPRALDTAGAEAAAAPAIVGPTLPAAAAETNAAAEQPVVVDGVQLKPGRITGSRSASGGGILRIAVANRGADPLDSSAGVEVAAMVNGSLIGSAPLGSVDGESSGAVELYLSSCPAGATTVVAIVDPRGVQVEGNERDNARTARVSFSC